MNCRKTSRTPRTTLPFALLFGVLPVTLLASQSEYTYHVETSSPVVSVIFNRARDQLAHIDLVLEELAQAAANNKLVLKNSQQARAYITQLRELTTRAHQFSAQHLTPESAQKLVELNNLLLKRLSRALTYKFRFTSKVNTDITAYLSRSAQDSAHTLDIAQVHALLLKNDDLLLDIPKRYTQLGITLHQRLARQTIKYIKHSQAVTVSKRVLPYIGLGAYYILINKEEALPHWWIVQKIKSILGKLPKSTKRHELVTDTQTGDKNKVPESPKPQENTQEHTAEDQNQNNPNSTGADREHHEVQQEQNIIVEDPVSDGKSESNSIQERYSNGSEYDPVLDTLEGLRRELRKTNTILKQARQEKSHTEKGTGFGAIFNKIGKLVDVETKSFYTIMPAAFFLPIIKRDLEDLSKLASRTAARITGDTPKSDTLTKQSKLTFTSIVGFEHVKQSLNSAIGYFKHKKLFKRTGASADKNYLLVGSLDLGKQFAYALAGEITHQFIRQKKDKHCGIYEIHASVLTGKKLTQILKDLEAETPCVILLSELDWLTTHVTDTAVWADIQTAYAQLEKKDILLIATLESARALDTLHAHHSFGVTLELGLPTDDERAVFIQKELEKYAVLPKQVSSRALAHKTAGCTYAQISKVLEKALSNAHAIRTTLTQEHIERSIDELIYGIIPSDTLSHTEQTMLAAYYAGKAIAYKHLYNDQSILKVTLLPVRKHVQQEQGALITTHNYTNNFALARSELEKQAIIELAGIQAQRLLLGHASRTLEDQAHKYAFTQTKASILEGISEYDLPKKAREDLLHQAWNLTTEYSRQAQLLVETQRESIQKIADKLVLHKTLSAEEIN
jgi:ATP-dependent Zn protease